MANINPSKPSEILPPTTAQAECAMNPKRKNSEKMGCENAQIYKLRTRRTISCTKKWRDLRAKNPKIATLLDRANKLQQNDEDVASNGRRTSTSRENFPIASRGEHRRLSGELPSRRGEASNL